MQVILAVTDLERSLAFYESAFDWPRNARIDYANYVELHPPDGGTVGLYEREGYAQTVGADHGQLDREGGRGADCGTDSPSRGSRR